MNAEFSKVDFLMTVKSNGWQSDQLKYQDMAKDSANIVDMLDDLDFNVKTVSFIFEAQLNYDQVMRLFKLLVKGLNHITYHLGRNTRPTVTYRKNVDTMVLGELCTVYNAVFDGKNPAKVKIAFENALTLRNQNLRGSTIMVNFIRFANCIAWASVYKTKLSDKPITLKTWNTITIWRENPWLKKTEEVEAHPSSPEEDDLYNEE